MTAPVVNILDTRDNLNTMLYRFEKVGDTLELHSHTFAHQALVETGDRFEWFTEKNHGEVVGPHVLTFPAGVPHGMRALNDGASCFVVMPAVV